MRIFKKVLLVWFLNLDLDVVVFSRTAELLKNPEKHDDKATSANIKMAVALFLSILRLKAYDRYLGNNPNPDNESTMNP